VRSSTKVEVSYFRQGRLGMAGQGLLEYDSKPQSYGEVFFMKTWSAILWFPAISLVALSLLVKEYEAKAAAPRGAATGSSATPASATDLRAVASPTGAATASIPDTVLAINFDKPMSQRVVHYEIDAK